MKVAWLSICFVLVAGMPKNQVDRSKAVSKNIYFELKDRKPPPINPRIVGGIEETPHASPHQVGLFINGYAFCGGSLISRNYVLTAAHCCVGAGEMEVVLGAHNITAQEATQISFISTEFIVHPDWDIDKLINDICLVKLDEPAPINSNIAVIQLASSKSGSFANKLSKLTGWGKTSDLSSDISPVLMKLEVPVITNDDCTVMFGDVVQPSHICISGNGIKGGCSGDSGSALVVDGKQVGIDSYGSRYCEAGYPTGFTRISSFIDWISDNSDVAFN